MRLRGVHYDVGTDTIDGGLTRGAPPDAVAEREIVTIARELHANAIRVSGRDPTSLLAVGERAVAHDLEVWLSPQLLDRSPEATLDVIVETARGAERLRERGGSVVLVVGCEVSVFMRGILPGNDVRERFALLTDPSRLLPAVMASGIDPQATMQAFLSDAARAARAHFSGPVTYAAGLWEDIDWEPFDLIGIDAYREATNRATFAADIGRSIARGRPVVVTEFGC